MSSSYCKQVRLHVWSFIWSKDLDQLPFFTLEFYNSDVSQPAFSIRFTVRYCCFSATFCPHWNEWWNSQVMSSCPCHGLHDIFPRESIEPRSLLSHSHSHSLYTYHGPPGPTIPTPGTAQRRDGRAHLSSSFLHGCQLNSAPSPSLSQHTCAPFHTFTIMAQTD